MYNYKHTSSICVFRHEKCHQIICIIFLFLGEGILCIHNIDGVSFLIFYLITIKELTNLMKSRVQIVRLGSLELFNKLLQKSKIVLCLTN
jgi:hypothetical protein